MSYGIIWEEDFDLKLELESSWIFMTHHVFLFSTHFAQSNSGSLSWKRSFPLQLFLFTHIFPYCSYLFLTSFYFHPLELCTTHTQHFTFPFFPQQTFFNFFFHVSTLLCTQVRKLQLHAEFEHSCLCCKQNTTCIRSSVYTQMEPSHILIFILA